jgi:hypothetical protein
LRIVSWNCGSGFHRKVGALSALAPDIAVIQECADLDTLARKSPEFVPSDALWIGDNPNRGLTVFSFGQYRLARANAEAVAITYALPARVIGPNTFNLVVRKIRLLRRLVPQNGASEAEAETASRLVHTLMERYSIGREDLPAVANRSNRMTWVYWEQLLAEFGVNLNRFGGRASASLGSG